MFELNDGLHHVIIESHKKIGGERKLNRIRMSDRALPLTLREDFSEMVAGYVLQRLGSIGMRL